MPDEAHSVDWESVSVNVRKGGAHPEFAVRVPLAGDPSHDWISEFRRHVQAHAKFGITLQARMVSTAPIPEVEFDVAKETIDQCVAAANASVIKVLADKEQAKQQADELTAANERKAAELRDRLSGNGPAA